MDKHTPLPWHVHDMEKTTICTPGGLAIVTSNSPGPSTNENKANAAYIVRAVNCHEEMLAELKKFDRYIRNNETGEHGSCVLCKLIAKAEGK